MLTRRTVNVLMLSIGFLLLFIPFQTMSNILVTVINSIRNDDSNYETDAKDSLAIVYAVLAVSNFLAPSIISILGARLSIVLGAVTYSIYIGSFLFPINYVLYVASAIIGIGAAIIWTAQGTYLTQNSDNLTISRNSGIFWATFQCSQLLGNLFVFYAFQNKTHIDSKTRNFVYITLTVISIIGIFILLLLRSAVGSGGEAIANNRVGPAMAMKRVLTLFTEGKMLLLCISFWFTGALLSFAGSIYNPCIGSTKELGDNRKSLVGLGGVFFGIGEVLGGTVFGCLGSKTVIYGRNPIIFAGCIDFLICFGLIYLNIPNSAVYGDTDEVSFFAPPIWWLAVLCSFLLGFGDSCFNTQIYSIIGTLWREDSSPSFGMFKFIQSVSTGLAFFYSKYLGLHQFLIILAVTVVLAFFTFIFVERTAAKLHKEQTAVAASAVRTRRVN